MHGFLESIEERSTKGHGLANEVMKCLNRVAKSEVGDKMIVCDCKSS